MICTINSSCNIAPMSNQAQDKNTRTMHRNRRRAQTRTSRKSKMTEATAASALLTSSELFHETQQCARICERVQLQSAHTTSDTTSSSSSSSPYSNNWPSQQYQHHLHNYRRNNFCCNSSSNETSTATNSHTQPTQRSTARRRHQQQLAHYGSSLHHRCTRALVGAALLLFAAALLVSAADELSVAAAAAAAASAANAVASTTAASASATVAAASTATNVIMIRYANVTGDDGGEDATPLDSMQVYKLYDEPLSVSVIESKFSHSIKTFDVSHNQLSTLPKDLFCPLANEVRKLNISHNLIENYDCLGLISQAGQLCLGELRVLDMSYNLIKHLPATGVASLRNVEILDLSHNIIETLDEMALQTLEKLITLDLSHNRIQQLPARLFLKSSSVQVIRLQSNLLHSQISQTLLAGLVSLQELNLSHNNISQVGDSAFIDKLNLSRVDLSHNQISGLQKEALRISARVVGQQQSQQQQQQQYPTPVVRHRLHHNGQYAGPPTVQQQQQQQQQQHQPRRLVEVSLAANPFICDCQLEWLRKINSHSGQQAINKRTVLSNSQQPHPDTSYQAHDLMSAQLMQLTSSFQNDQPPVISASSPSTEQQQQQQQQQTSNNVSEITSAQEAASATSQSYRSVVSSQQQQQHVAALDAHHQYARVADLDLIKCTPLFRRNQILRQQQQFQQYMHQQQQHHGHSRQAAPSGGSAELRYGPNNHHHHHALQHHSSMHHSSSSHMDAAAAAFAAMSQIDLLTADSTAFLCRYKSHCFALCGCCDFDACDCEMICPTGCNCYYGSHWQTNIIDCSSNNHTVVPSSIPMDVSGLYLDGNNIESLKPSNLIARKQLKSLYLNSSNLQYIANRTFNGLIELQTLYLNDNQLRTLHGYEFEPLTQLKALYLQSNRLDHISNHTFINLRSLEILDLSNNRLTSSNLALFWSIGHHNIRLRRLAIAHNWWSCQCASIKNFRQILKQKLLLAGIVSIVDKHQLRCYYNSTTVGPLILESANSINNNNIKVPPFAISRQQATAASSSSTTAFGSLAQQQQQLSEVNHCSELIEDHQPELVDVNPPLIDVVVGDALNNNAGDEQSSDTASSSSAPHPAHTQLDQPIYTPPNLIAQGGSDAAGFNVPNLRMPSNDAGMLLERSGSGSGSATTTTTATATTSMPLTSFIMLSVLTLGAMVIAASIFVFVRQQQHYHQSHHKKSSAASTTSASSSASSTAISSLNGAAGKQRAAALAAAHAAGHYHHHQHHQHHASQAAHFNTAHHTMQHHHNLIMANGTATTANINHQQRQQQQHHINTNLTHHPQHSASSHSNIYAALVSPTHGNTTQVGANNHNNNAYSNSSHHSGAVNSQAAYQQQQWHTQQHQSAIYSSQAYNLSALGQTNGLENPYAVSAAASYKTGSSLYNAPHNNVDLLTAHHNHHQHHHHHQQHQQQQQLTGDHCSPDSSYAHAQEHTTNGADWTMPKLPKVKQFMSKLVNKSLALGGYRASSSRDDMAAISASSDKIYDAFISYDKRDEPFVMQHLSAELEYGQPQFRITDRFRELHVSTSAYMAETITSVIGFSHRTVVVLTENYLASEWCRFELQAALREASVDKSHKIIAIVLDPKCLLELDAEMRALLTNCGAHSMPIYAPASAGSGGGSSTSGCGSTSHQLVQLDSSTSSEQPLPPPPPPAQASQSLVATLVSGASSPSQQVSTRTAQLATSRITFINYNERKFWPKIKQLMPSPRPSTHALTLTTKN